MALAELVLISFTISFGIVFFGSLLIVLLYGFYEMFKNNSVFRIMAFITIVLTIIISVMLITIR